MSVSWVLVLILVLILGCSGEGGCGACVDGHEATGATGATDATDAPQDVTEPTLPGITHPDVALDARLRAALAAKGPSYHPRTHHLRDDGAPRFVNRLILETSPYLLQHAHNPVDWNAWSEEPFERARREGKPVLVSIGYSTCHWCHVMERESFEDEEIAQYINEHFVAIKVDREERPDVDDVYMDVVQALTGAGGWPMTVVLTPDKDPLFGGTYFPPRDGAGGSRQGFLTVLRELSTSYTEDRQRLVERARELSQRMRTLAAPTMPAAVPDARVIETAVAGATASFDAVHGGFGRAPKFPRPAMLDLLLRYHRRTGDARILSMVVTTLEHMAAGGIHDHVGGGFHRYATDAEWLVPHFEKMLYDNAQLAAVYLSAYQVTGRADFATVARDILAYVTREMTSFEGVFYAATDADSLTPTGHEEEGYAFTWTPAEIRTLLGDEHGVEDATIVSAYYGVTERGNFEGRNILHVPRSAAVVARELHLTERALTERLTASREALRVARDLRPQPLRDDKIVASWNGLMISAFARGAMALDEPALATHASRASRRLLATLVDEHGTLHRYARDGYVSEPGYLDDYAFVIQALLDVFEATASIEWLDAAIRLQTVLDAGFWDDAAGGYFTTSRDHEVLLTREKPSYDSAEPSGNAIAILNLLRLHTITDDAAYRERAMGALGAFAPTLVRSPGASPMMLAALERALDEPFEILLVAPGDATSVDQASSLGPLRAGVAASYVPNRALVVTNESALLAMRGRVPWLEGKRALGGRPTAYVCERGRCALPTSDPTVLARQLRRVTPLSGIRGFR